MGIINRAPWTALVDDSGQNLDGSIWDKAAIKAVLLDPVDAAMTGSAINLSLTGVYYDYNPAGAAAATIWYCTPQAAGVYLTGVLAAPLGTTHLLINQTGFAMTLSNQHAASAAANRFIGPGFTDFALGSWRAVWILYMPGAWLIMAP